MTGDQCHQCHYKIIIKMKNSIIVFGVILSAVACSAKSFSPPCSPRPEGLDLLVAKCFKEHLDLNSFVDYADDPDTNIDSLNSFKACTLRELGFFLDGKIAIERVEAIINKWVHNEESAKSINEFLKGAVAEANKEYGEPAVARKFFVIVNAEENRTSLINREFC